MYTISAKNLNDAFLTLSELMLEEGKPVTSRGMKTLELHPVFLEIRNPTQRFLSINGRRNNPLQTIYETLWVLSGRNDIGALSYYMPRAKDYSDDGKTWTGGYGPRLYNWCPEPGVSNGVNQIQGVLDTFRKDMATRQAVVQIWDPDIDGPENDSRDKPCTNYLHFMIRDGKLDLMVVMRSNDLFWGFSAINIFEWTFLQEIIAGVLVVEVGKYYHVVDSLHIYTNYVEKLVDIANAPQSDIYLDEKVEPAELAYRSFDLFYSDARIFTEYMDSFNIGREVDPALYNDFANITKRSVWFQSAYEALAAYKSSKSKDFGEIISHLKNMVAKDMFVVVARYFIENNLWAEPGDKSLSSLEELYSILKKYKVASKYPC